MVDLCLRWLVATHPTTIDYQLSTINYQLMKRLAIQTIRVYKMAISPYLPNACRFQPTCSQYAIEAIERFGVARGSLMAAGRILRCNPFHPGGFDPVPPKDSTEND
ncbi:MAG: membrane protein insertion efficiency factor YidD [Microcoleus sp. SM1_3_4]|nr:membrane protein insertion efficiency factor YidD [Microcoleus sp. SM1_3_4]